MGTFQSITRSELVSIIDEFQRNNRVIRSNIFSLVDSSDYSVMCGKGTVLFRVPEFNYHRLFVLSTDLEELSSMLKSLDTEYVINIPSKKGIDDWAGVLEGSGFKHYTTYSRYLNLEVPNMEKRSTSTGSFAKSEELQQVLDLLYRSFPPYAAHLPDKEELESMIDEERVITDYGKDGKVCGVNIFTITGPTAYGNVWVDEGERGLEILFDMFNVFIDKGIKRFVFWVRDGNKNVIKLHKMLGAKPDGLKDYTFVKNIKICEP